MTPLWGHPHRPHAPLGPRYRRSGLFSAPIGISVTPEASWSPLQLAGSVRRSPQLAHTASYHPSTFPTPKQVRPPLPNLVPVARPHPPTPPPPTWAPRAYNFSQLKTPNFARFGPLGPISVAKRSSCPRESSAPLHVSPHFDVPKSRQYEPATFYLFKQAGRSPGRPPDLQKWPRLEIALKPTRRTSDHSRLDGFVIAL